jgi:hypothetical protein
MERVISSFLDPKFRNPDTSSISESQTGIQSGTNSVT